MFSVVITEKGGAQRRMDFDKNEVTIGRVQGNDIILPKGNVSKRHSRIVLKDNRFIVVDLKSTNGTYVNGRKITSPLVVKPGDKVYIGDFIMSVEESAAAAPVGAPAFGQGGPPPMPAAPALAAPVAPAPVAPAPVAPAPVAPALVAPTPVAVAPAPVAPVPVAAPVAPAPIAPVAAAPIPVAPVPVAAPVAPVPVAPAAPVSSVPVVRAAAPKSVAPRPQVRPSRPSTPPSEVSEGLSGLMGHLAAAFDVCDSSALAQSDLGRRNEAKAEIDAALDRLPQIAKSDDIARSALQEAVGLGVLEVYLADTGVVAISVDGPSRILIDRGQGLVPAKGSVSSAAMLATIGRRMLALGGRDPSASIGTITLPTGQSATVVLPPMAATTVIEIEQQTQAVSGESLVQRRVLNGAMLNVLSSAIDKRLGIAVIGPAGATQDLLSTLIGLTGEERLVTVDADGIAVARHHIALRSTATVSPAQTARHALGLRAKRLVVNAVTAADVFGVTNVAGSASGAIVGVYGGAGVQTLGLGIQLGGVPTESIQPLLAGAYSLVIEMEQVGGDIRVASMQEFNATGASPLYSWNGTDFTAENPPTF